MPRTFQEHLESASIIGEDPCVHAIKSYDLENFLELESKGYEYDLQDCLGAAATEGHLEAIKLFLECRGAKLDGKILGLAAYSGIETMEFLLERNCPMTRRTFEEASRSTVVRSISWLISKKCPMGPEAYDAVLEEEFDEDPKYQAFKLLYRNGCPFPISMERKLQRLKEDRILIWMRKQDSKQISR